MKQAVSSMSIGGLFETKILKRARGQSRASAQRVPDRASVVKKGGDFSSYTLTIMALALTDNSNIHI